MSNCQEMPPLMILCGGRGTRLRDVTELLPKPMVPIGPQPIVWHIMKCYAAFGVRRFILCLGYKREEFVHYFLNFRALTSDITLHPGTPGDIRYTGNCPESEWEITLADTGLDSCTATRIRLAARHLHPTDSCFFLTYGDAVADIDIRAVLKRHRAGGQLLTVSAVHPEGRFGEMRFDGDRVCGFTEKPARTEGYINGGIFNKERLQHNMAILARYQDDSYYDLDKNLWNRPKPDGFMNLEKLKNKNGTPNKKYQPVKPKYIIWKAIEQRLDRILNEIAIAVATESKIEKMFDGLEFTVKL